MVYVNSYVVVLGKNTGRPVLKKTVFYALASKLNMGLINKGWYGMFFACAGRLM